MNFAGRQLVGFFTTTSFGVSTDEDVYKQHTYNHGKDVTSQSCVCMDFCRVELYLFCVLNYLQFM